MSIIMSSLFSFCCCYCVNTTKRVLSLSLVYLLLCTRTIGVVRCAISLSMRHKDWAYCCQSVYCLTLIIVLIDGVYFSFCDNLVYIFRYVRKRFKNFSWTSSYTTFGKIAIKWWCSESDILWKRTSKNFEKQRN